MPIVDVEVVGGKGADAELAQRLADALGVVFGSRPRGTWVRVRYLEDAKYAENTGAQSGVAPIFVHVLQAEVPDNSALEVLARQLCTAVAEVCERPPEYVHLVFEPAAKGRIAFGGQLHK